MNHCDKGITLYLCYFPQLFSNIILDFKTTEKLNVKGSRVLSFSLLFYKMKVTENSDNLRRTI